MLSDALVRALHFVAIMALAASLVGAHLLTARELPRKTIKRIAIVDLVYGLSAIVVLIAGLLLWFVVGKPASYYLSNGLFHVKLTLFVVAVALSLPATLFWLKQRKGDPEEVVPVPKKVKAFQGVQMLLILVVIPVLASLLARGIGAGD